MAGDGRKLAAVTLDVDGTLYSIRRLVLRHPLLMLSLADFFRDLHAVWAGLRGQGPIENFEQLQARLFARRRGLGEEEARRLIRTVTEERWLAAFRGLKPFRGLKEVLQRLIGRGLKLGLISDYPLEGKLKALGLSDLPFACRLVTTELGALKPHPAAFLRATEQLQQAAGDILHIGDREDCDVAGAKAAGMRAALFCPGRRPAQSRADLVFSNWRLVERELERRNWLP